LLTESLS